MVLRYDFENENSRFFTKNGQHTNALRVQQPHAATTVNDGRRRWIACCVESGVVESPAKAHCS